MEMDMHVLVCYDKITRNGKEIHLEQGTNKALVTLLLNRKAKYRCFFYAHLERRGCVWGYKRWHISCHIMTQDGEKRSEKKKEEDLENRRITYHHCGIFIFCPESEAICCAVWFHGTGIASRVCRSH